MFGETHIYGFLRIQNDLVGEGQLDMYGSFYDEFILEFPVSAVKKMVSGALFRNPAKVLLQCFHAAAEKRVEHFEISAPADFPDQADESLQDQHGFMHRIFTDAFDKTLRKILGKPYPAGDLFKPDKKFFFVHIPPLYRNRTAEQPF